MRNDSARVALNGDKLARNLQGGAEAWTYNNCLVSEVIADMRAKRLPLPEGQELLKVREQMKEIARLSIQFRSQYGTSTVSVPWMELTLFKNLTVSKTCRETGNEIGLLPIVCDVSSPNAGQLRERCLNWSCAGHLKAIIGYMLRDGFHGCGTPYIRSDLQGDFENLESRLGDVLNRADKKREVLMDLQRQESALEESR